MKDFVENLNWGGNRTRLVTDMWVWFRICSRMLVCVSCLHCFTASVTPPAIIAEYVPAVWECTSLALFSPSQMQWCSKELSTFSLSLSKQSLSLHHLSEIIDRFTTSDLSLFIWANLHCGNEKFYRNWGKYFSKHFPTSTDHTLHNLFCFFHRYVS